MRRGQSNYSTYMVLRNKARTQFVCCRICGKVLRVINKHHLLRHGITTEEYKRKYHLASVCCEEVNFQRACRPMTYTDQEILSFIRERHRKRETLRASQIKRQFPTLYSSAIRLFQSWGGAPSNAVDWRAQRPIKPTCCASGPKKGFCSKSDAG